MNLWYKSMVVNEVMTEIFNTSLRSIGDHAISDAQQHLTRSHAYSFVTIVVKSVCACHPERMEIDKNVLVMIR